MGMTFRVADLQQQMKDMAKIAERFLEPGSRNKLAEAANQLDLIYDELRTRARAFRHHRKLPRPCDTWRIDEPIVTKWNEGKHEKDGRRGPPLQGSLRFVWTLGYAEQNRVELVELASTEMKINLLGKGTNDDVSTEAEIREVLGWHVDVVTNDNPPGPTVHVQLDNQERIPVPRFPTVLFAPADCLDFLLGELFQNEWTRHQQGHNQLKRFAPGQRDRLTRLLRGHLDWLAEPQMKSSKRSAWIHLKDAPVGNVLSIDS
jgi:hypothetical protein